MKSINSIGQSVGEFAFGMMDQLSNKQNLVFSPLSIYTSLALAAYGSNNNTQSQFQNVMKVESMQQLVDFIKTIQNIFIEEKKSIQISMGNQILVGLQKTKINEDYENGVKNDLKSSVENIDFSSNTDQIIQNVNAWVNSVTNGKIQDILAKGSIDALTRVILVNAIYFKGNWNKKFNEDKTQKLPWFQSGKKQKSVPMMMIQNSFKYLEADNYQFISIPYSNNDYSLTIFLPSKSDLTDLEKNFTYKDFVQTLGDSTNTMVDLTLPKFKIQGQSSTSLKEALSNLGLADCFTNHADFSNIYNDNQLFLSDVLHKAMIEVNESGTEAADATASIMRKRCRLAPTSTTMICNKPFIYALVHQVTRTILFMGKILNPSQD